MLVSLEDCTASSLSLCNKFITSTCAPSAVSIKFCPSSAFLTACVRPLIVLSILLTMAIPAASSEAEFILKPEDSLSMASSIAR